MRRPVGVKWVVLCFRWTRFFSSRRVAAVAMLPSALSRSDFVSLGACWAFSFQPVLPSVCRPVVPLFHDRTWARRLTQSPELGFRLLSFPFLERLIFVLSFVLCCCRHCRSAAVVQRFVRFSAHPQVMQQHRQLSGGRDDGSLLPALAAALGQLQPQRRRSQSTPNGPRMCCAPCTSSVRRYGSPSLLMCICGSLFPEFLRPGCNPR